MLRWTLPFLAVLQVLAGVLHDLTGVGQSIAERSGVLTTPITPVGATFAIWGPTYLGCLAASVWLALPRQHRSGNWTAVQGWLAGAMVSNTVWPLWVQLVNLDAVSVVVICVTLWMLLGTLRCWHDRPQPQPISDRLAVGVPVSVFAGWVTLATFVNVACTSQLLGLEAFVDPMRLACGLLLACAALALRVHSQCGGNPAYLAPIIWGLVGIWRRPDVTEASYLGLALAVTLGAVALSSLRSSRRRPEPLPL